MLRRINLSCSYTNQVLLPFGLVIPDTPANPLPPDRLPLAPLMAASGSSGVSAFAAVISKSRFTVYRLLKSGLSIWEADRMATHIVGLHPFFIWGNEWLDALNADGDMEEAA